MEPKDESTYAIRGTYRKAVICQSVVMRSRSGKRWDIASGVTRCRQAWRAESACDCWLEIVFQSFAAVSLPNDGTDAIVVELCFLGPKTEGGGQAKPGSAAKL